MFLKCNSRQSNCCLGTPWSFYSFHRKLRLWGIVSRPLFFKKKSPKLTHFRFSWFPARCLFRPASNISPSFFLLCNNFKTTEAHCLLKSSSFSQIASEPLDLAAIHSSRAGTCALASAQLTGRMGPEHSHLSPLVYLHPSICGHNEG